MNNVKSTQLNGMKSQIESWLLLIPDMEGYEPEDYNTLYELEAALMDAQDQIYYALNDNE